MFRIFLSGRRLVAAFLMLGAGLGAEEKVPNPIPREILETRPGVTWSFDDSNQGWRTENDARLLPFESSLLAIESTGTDPILVSPEFEPAPAGSTLVFKMRSTSPGSGRVFWIGKDAPGPSEEFALSFPTTPDGEWHRYEITCPHDFRIRQVRIDPATSPGRCEFEWIRMEHRVPHPIEIQRVQQDGKILRASVFNHSETPIMTEKHGPLAPGSSALEIALPKPDALLSRAEVMITSPNFPPVKRPFIRLGSEAFENGPKLEQGDLTVELSLKGGLAGAAISRNGTPISWFGPLVLPGHEIDAVFRNKANGDLSVTGGECLTTLRIEDDVLHIEMSSPSRPFEMAFYFPGSLEQGLVAGVEHLGKEERSSSKLDLRGPEHLRYKPDPHLMTMPLMSVVTDQGSAGLLWKDPTLQPRFATPDFIDGTPFHRMSLEGEEMDLRLHLGKSWGDGGRLEDVLLWAVKARGLPEPPPLRPLEEQLALCRHAMLDGPMRADGWTFHHALIPGTKKMPETPQAFADQLACVGYLTGEFPQVDPIPGGGHIEDPTFYFKTGRREEWVGHMDRRAENIRQAQQADGSFRYVGKYAEGHFEDTASGQCAIPTVKLLRHAQLTGNEASKEAGLRSLEFMKRFRTPRGAQVWECPLHSPDLMASAHLVSSYTLGFELTGDQTYLVEARRWALSGLPFIYQWKDPNFETMSYATIAILCATNWDSPVWIGRPVQWCGLVYADAILDLAEHEQTLDWKKIATGILASAEQQQYTEGPSKGLLADSLTLKDQALHPYDINPTSLVLLRLRIEGRDENW